MAAGAIVLTLFSGSRPTLADPSSPDDLEAARAIAATRYFQELKRMQVELLHGGARTELARIKRWKPPRPTRRAGIRVPRALEEGGRDRDRAARSKSSPRRFVAESALDPDVRVNDRYSDQTPVAMQSEVSIAASGLDQVAAWNDAEWRFTEGPIGFATSRDGGRTWTDGGAPPVGGNVAGWVSDPVVAVDEKRRTFYLVGMAIARTSGPKEAPLLASAIAVARGSFSDAGFAWEPPRIVRSTRDTLPDKPWIAADSATGNVYVSYTTFMQRNGAQSDRIDFQRSTDGGRTWSVPVRLSSDQDEGLVQGSRPSAGVDGIVDVVWGAVDTTRASGGLDYKRLRRSRDGGATFQEPSTVTALYANFGTGGPGFNRGNGFDFPGIASDRSHGPHRGRVYVVWQEGLDYYDDYPAGEEPVIVDEGRPATPFRIGELLRGRIDSQGDEDLLRFSGAAGQTVIFYVDSLDTSLDLALRLLCADGHSQIAYNAPTWRGRPRSLVVTLPETGDYVVSVALHGTAAGGYRIRTGLVPRAGERARDHRDVFVCHSDDGVHWSEPRLVNDDEARFDDWLPEVAVSARGGVYAAWYDWRDSPPEACGTWSRVRLARSDDGGDSWAPLGALADVATAWSDVISNIAPNQGDYIALFADDRAVRAAWADGRDGDPDVYSAAHALDLDPPLVPGGAPPRVASVHPNPARRTIRLELALGRAAPVRAELLDPTGRRRREFALGAGAGLQRFELDLGPGLRAGVYFLRLTQLGETAVARIAVVP